MHDFSGAKRLGTPILYCLGESDFRQIITDRRNAGQGTARGNDPREGQVYPGVIVADWGGSVNLQVFLDGNDTYWPTSRSEFDPEKHGRRRYFLPAPEGSELEAAGENTELTFEEYESLAGPNDVGAGRSSFGDVRIVFEPDARGHWIPAVIGAY